MDSPWKIELFGRLRVQSDARSIERFRTQRSALLLAYLAYYAHKTHSREVLIELLWPDVEQVAGRNRLKQEIACLRRQIEPPGVPAGAVLIADRFTLRLNPNAISTDVSCLQETLRLAAQTPTPADRVALLQEAATLCQAEFLPGFFEEWVLAVRQEMADTEQRILEQLIDAQNTVGDLRGAISSGNRLVQQDPLREESYLQLIRLYATHGQTAEALRLFEEMRNVLSVQAGLEPSAKAWGLLQQIQRVHQTPVENSEPVLRVVSPSEPVAPPIPAPVQSSPIAKDELQRTRLPLRFNRFFGRETELHWLEDQLALLESGRLLTLTGPGGSGKTRLAIEAGERMADTFRGMVAFVPLAEVTTALGIPSAILNALSLKRLPDATDPMEQLVVALSRLPPSLLILDNLEQLVDIGGAEVVEALRERVPGLVCLVTSRIPLGLSGEREMEVSPLPFPVPSTTTPPGNPDSRPEHLMEFASIRMFVDRAQSALQVFQLTPRNASVVATLCAQLEGIPLAIELTAAWARTLTPAQMLARFSSERDSLLVSQRKDLPPRHRTMHATIAWSFNLLPQELQRFFAHLSIFRGGWTLEALEEVSAEPKAFKYLNRLRQCSLVLAEERGDAHRYHLLEILREFAAEQLLPAEEAELARRHLTTS